jgi:hypothetical protein
VISRFKRQCEKRIQVPPGFLENPIMTLASSVTPNDEEDEPVPKCDGSNFTCPTCSGKLVYEPQREGRPLSCPACDSEFPMPVNELSVLMEIRDNTAEIRSWMTWIFWLVALLLASLIF